MAARRGLTPGGGTGDVPGIEGVIEAASAAAGAAVVVGEASRRYWTRRELRQQAGFRAAVQAIVDESIRHLINRQAEFERRQGQHLDRQDRAIEQLRKAIVHRNGTG